MSFHPCIFGAGRPPALRQPPEAGPRRAPPVPPPPPAEPLTGNGGGAAAAGSGRDLLPGFPFASAGASRGLGPPRPGWAGLGRAGPGRAWGPPCGRALARSPCPLTLCPRPQVRAMGPLCGGAAGRLLRVAGAGAGRRLLLLSAARGSGSPAGGNPAVRREALAVKKRGYDITRNPHLNKVGAASRCPALAG